ncbi:MAG: saccharopine dehydrogenase NADP-binding domain-containing protein [Cyclobacteriaceae bacterium]|nr:saccharopine dehydrogenase NADP-binding domain-containing protein [Cyclobacteriaceae bacterium]
MIKLIFIVDKDFMEKENTILVYGSYGYTGRLIVDLCRERKLSVILAGRNRDKLQEQANQCGYPFEVLDLKDKDGLVNLLHKVRVVIHCGGPFQETARIVAEVCLQTQTHYTDITGEYQVFEDLTQLHEQAIKANICILPGAGFDVVPSDCLATMLKKELPTATHLQLAFVATGGGLSRGTAKTMTLGMGYGSVVRQNGKLKNIPIGKTAIINFGAFTMETLNIPWGDIATAYRSTGIPNIEVYTGVPKSSIRMAKLSHYIQGILRLPFIKKTMLKKIDDKPAGPSEEKRNKSKTYLYGKAWDKNKTVELRLLTPNGYSLTAATSVEIATRLLQEKRSGYMTPAQAFGENFILSFDGVKLL